MSLQRDDRSRRPAGKASRSISFFASASLIFLSGCDDPYRGQANEPCLPFGVRSAEATCQLAELDVTPDGDAGEWSTLNEKTSAADVSVQVVSGVWQADASVGVRIIAAPVSSNERVTVEFSAPESFATQERHAFVAEGSSVLYFQNGNPISFLDARPGSAALLADGFELVFIQRLLPWTGEAIVQVRRETLDGGQRVSGVEGPPWHVCWDVSKQEDPCGMR